MSCALAICPLATRKAIALTVNCGADKTISAAVAALKPSTSYQQITVEGACSANVYIPPNLSVTLLGAKGASLAPANASNPTINLRNLALNASAGNIALNNSGQYGLSVNACSVGINVQNGESITISSNGAINGYGAGVSVSGGSYVQLNNVSITNNAYNGVNAFVGAAVNMSGVTIAGNAGLAVGTAKNGVINFFNGHGINTITEPSTVPTSSSTATRAARFMLVRSPAPSRRRQPPPIKAA